MTNNKCAHTHTHTHTVVSCSSSPSPLYLEALMPTPEDATDPTASESAPDKSPSPPTSSHSRRLSSKSNDPGGMKEEKDFGAQDFFENPFLKPPKRIQLKPL